MKKIWADDGWDDYLKLQRENKRLLQRVNNLLKDIERNVYDGTGKPEPLKGDLSGWYSRRVDKEHRLIYREVDGMIEIMRCYSHYGDK